jgi:hypothetical protein
MTLLLRPFELLVEQVQMRQTHIYICPLDRPSEGVLAAGWGTVRADTLPPEQPGHGVWGYITCLNPICHTACWNMNQSHMATHYCTHDCEYRPSYSLLGRYSYSSQGTTLCDSTEMAASLMHSFLGTANLQHSMPDDCFKGW